MSLFHNGNLQIYHILNNKLFIFLRGSVVPPGPVDSNQRPI